MPRQPRLSVPLIHYLEGVAHETKQQAISEDNRNRPGYHYDPYLDRGEYAECDVPSYDATTHAEE